MLNQESYGIMSAIRICVSIVFLSLSVFIIIPKRIKKMLYKTARECSSIVTDIKHVYIENYTSLLWTTFTMYLTVNYLHKCGFISNIYVHLSGLLVRSS